MSERWLARLAFMVVGLCFATWGLIRIADTSYWFFDRGSRPDPGIALGMFLPGFLGLVAGVCIWQGAQAIADRTVLAEGAAAHRGVARSEGLLAIILSGIGVFLLVEGLSGLAKAGALLYLTHHGAPTEMDFADNDLWKAKVWNGFAKADMAAAAVRVLLAIGLLLGPTRLAAAFARVRREFSGSLEREGQEGGPEAMEKDSGA